MVRTESEEEKRISKRGKKEQLDDGLEQREKRSEDVSFSNESGFF